MEDYLKIISCKTAALFKAAMVSGAYSVNAPQEYLEAVSGYAENLGLAFQMKDDIFDYTPQLNVGKKLGVDILEQKITLPLIEALKRSGGQDNARIRDMVRRIREDESLKDEIVAFVEASDGVAHAKETLISYSEKAVSCLNALPRTREKEILEELAMYMVDRDI